MTLADVQVVLDYISKINAGDVQGIEDSLAPHHRFIDMQGEIAEGRDRLGAGWRNYLSANPRYHIYLRRIFALPEAIVLVGHTTGSHLGFSEEEEFHNQGIIWKVTTANGQIASWQLIADTVEDVDKLGLDAAEEIFEPKWMAATIAKHLDLLPEGFRTNDVRNVRKYYSRIYRHAPAEVMVATTEHLFFDEGYRFVPYELLFHHKGAIQSLTPHQVERFGDGLHDWSSTDIYAHYVAGPAWKAGVIDDALTSQWLHSNSVWWRRAAVVSTIYLYGDVEKMLRYSEALVDDHEDMIVKAVSWVLRSAIQYDREAVEAFLKRHHKHLAARVRREVRNKLETGLKNPKK